MKKIPVIALFTLLVFGGLSGCATSPSHTISFETNGGTTLDPITGRSGTIIDEEIVTTKDDYVFKGWYSDEGLQNKVSSLSSYPYADVTLYAKWAKEVTVSFETNGGSVKADIIGVEGDPIILGENPTKNNAEFENWYVDESLENVFAQSTYGVEDIKLYASYTDFPTLSFVTNLTGVTIPSITQKGGTELPTLATWIPNNLDAKFDGWYEDEEFNTRFNYLYMPSDSTTLYAKFNYKHTLTLMSNGTEYKKIEAYTNDPIETPAIPTNSGKYLDGWYYTVTDTNDTKFSFDRMPDQDLTLTAVWVDNPKITFIDSFDESTITTLSYTPDSVVGDISATLETTYLSAIDHPNLTFSGWYTKDADGNYDPFYFTSNTKIGKNDITLYALWQDKVIITFDGSTKQVELTSSHPSIIESDLPTYAEDQVVVGWYENSAFTGSPIIFPYTSDVSKVIYPKLANKITLTLKIGNETFTVVGGENEKIELNDEIQAKIDEVVATYTSTSYEWRIGTDSAPGTSLIDLKEFPSSNMTIWLCESSSFIPDIGI